MTIREARCHTAPGDAPATALVPVKMLPMLMARAFGTFGDVIARTGKQGRPSACLFARPFERGPARISRIR